MAATKKKCMFGVRVNKVEIIAAEIPIQEHWLPLSNLDLLVPPFHPSTFFCYKKPAVQHKHYTYESMVSILKKAAAKTLVPFYPLAGEIVQNGFGEPEIFCNNRGVDFIEAYADVDLAQLDFYNSDDSIAKLVPPLTRGIISFQATELKCGGIAVGCTGDHRITDGYSAQLFMQAWIECAQGNPISCIPSFRRSLLYSLHSGGREHDPLLKYVYAPVSEHNYDDDDDVKLESSRSSRNYYIKAEDISKIQLMANSDNNSNKISFSKFEAFCAFLWKTLALSTTTTDDDDIGGVDKIKKSSRLSVAVDGRSRLGAGDANKLKSLQAYYGNVISNPFSEKECRELKERPLSWIANEIHDFVKAAATKQHFLGLIDFVEAHRPEQVLSKINTSGVADGMSVFVSAGHQFPIAKMDFGWGTSAFSCNYIPLKKKTGYVMTMPSAVESGDWIVYISMDKQKLDFLENNAAPHLFNPLTSAYLNLCYTCTK